MIQVTRQSVLTRKMNTMELPIIQEHLDKPEFDGWFTEKSELTKEQQYYKKIFDDLYPNKDSVIPYYWMPKWSDTKDPSARTL